MKCNFLLIFLMFYSLNDLTAHQIAIGKTHFIVGGSQENNIETCPLHVSLPVEPLILFAPGDNVRTHLIQLINKEQEAIFIAVFMITDGEVVQALVDAKKRGIIIEVITDVGCLKDKASKVNQLCKYDCAIFIYNPTLSSKRVSLMHNKFALFAKNDSEKKVWTGSYNFTRSANDNNQENVVIFSDAKIFNQYFTRFKQLKQKSYQYSQKKLFFS